VVSGCLKLEAPVKNLAPLTGLCWCDRIFVACAKKSHRKAFNRKGRKEKPQRTQRKDREKVSRFRVSVLGIGCRGTGRRVRVSGPSVAGRGPRSCRNAVAVHHSATVPVPMSFRVVDRPVHSGYNDGHGSLGADGVREHGESCLISWLADASSNLARSIRE
jgi:hypothetical protein